jgi:hypothetical protein
MVVVTVVCALILLLLTIIYPSPADTSRFARTIRNLSIGGYSGGGIGFVVGVVYSIYLWMRIRKR